MPKSNQIEEVCLGCLSIENGLFPFCDGQKWSWHKEKGFFIDQEGCGVDGMDDLEIKYCPVCGKILCQSQKT